MLARNEWRKLGMSEAPLNAVTSKSRTTRFCIDLAMMLLAPIIKHRKGEN